VPPPTDFGERCAGRLRYLSSQISTQTHVIMSYEKPIESETTLTRSVISKKSFKCIKFNILIFLLFL